MSESISVFALLVYFQNMMNILHDYIFTPVTCILLHALKYHCFLSRDSDSSTFLLSKFLCFTMHKRSSVLQKITIYYVNCVVARGRSNSVQHNYQMSLCWQYFQCPLMTRVSMLSLSGDSFVKFCTVFGELSLFFVAPDILSNIQEQSSQQV